MGVYDSCVMFVMFGVGVLMIPLLGIGVVGCAY